MILGKAQKLNFNVEPIYFKSKFVLIKRMKSTIIFKNN